jgi:YHS domain-containing protein
MVSLLFRPLAIILVLGLVWIVLAKIFSASRRQSPRASEKPSNNMVKDPVCGMYMDSRLAVRLENRKEAHFFCSEECKNKYLANQPPQDPPALRCSAGITKLAISLLKPDLSSYNEPSSFLNYLRG